MSTGNSSPFVKLTGLWEATSKRGAAYLRGRLGDVTVMVFPVRERTENGPTHELVIAPRQQQPAKPAEPAQHRTVRDEEIF